MSVDGSVELKLKSPSAQKCLSKMMRTVHYTHRKSICLEYIMCLCLVILVSLPKRPLSNLSAMFSKKTEYGMLSLKHKW